MSLQSLAHVNGCYLNPTSVFTSKPDVLFADFVNLGAKRSNRRLIGAGARVSKGLGFRNKRLWSSEIKSVLDFDRVASADSKPKQWNPSLGYSNTQMFSSSQVAQGVDVKPTNRELPADLFSSNFSPFAAPGPVWYPAPQYGMGFNMQYNVPMHMPPAYLQQSKPSNPFDVNQSSSVQASTSPEAQLKEMSAFAIGRLAQDTHNQAGIAYDGGITPLLKLLDSKNGTLQHNGAFALYGLADNEDNAADFVRVGGIQKLLDGEYILQPTRDCVAKMLKRLEEKTQGRVLRRLLYLMLNADKVIQRRIALSLAHLCSPGDLKTVFVDNNGIDLLMELLQSIHSRLRGYASVSLCKLAEKTTSLSSVDAGPSSPTSQVYLGEKYVNNPTLCDVTFVVEGKRFYAHRICLLASSDAFRAMFDGGYREKDAKDIKIPNISWETFELMMRYIYTGSVEISSSVAHDLLKAADQYLLEGLKRCCEYTIAQDITADNVELMYDLSEAFNAVSLRNACILFILEHFQTLDSTPWYGSMVQRILPEIRTCFVNRLTEK